MSKPKVIKNSLDISFDARIDPRGALELIHEGEPLSHYSGLEVECDATEIVTFRLNRFQHAGTFWSLSGDPRLSTNELNEPLPGPWEIDQVTGNMTAAVQVAMTASTENEPPKTQKIFVKTKPRTDLPDPQMTGQ